MRVRPPRTRSVQTFRPLMFCGDVAAQRLLTLCERSHSDEKMEVVWLDAQFVMEWLICIRTCRGFEQDFIRPTTEVISKLEKLEETESVALQHLISMNVTMQEKMHSTQPHD